MNTEPVAETNATATMPDHPPTTELPPPPLALDDTTESDAVGSDTFTDEDELWLANTHTKGVRVRVPIALLVLATVALVGIWGGAKLNERNAPATLAAGGLGGAGGFGGAGGTGGAGGQGRAAAAAAAGGAGAAGQANGQGGAGGGTGGQGRGGFGGGTVGTVQSVDGNKITLQTQNGQTVTVNLSDSTTISKTDTGTPADVKQGETLVVRGTANGDGVTEAQSVQIGAPGGAAGGFGGGGFGGGQGQGQGAGGQAPAGAPPGG